MSYARTLLTSIDESEERNPLFAFVPVSLHENSETYIDEWGVEYIPSEVYFFKIEEASRRKWTKVLRDANAVADVTFGTAALASGLPTVPGLNTFVYRPAIKGIVRRRHGLHPFIQDYHQKRKAIRRDKSTTSKEKSLALDNLEADTLQKISTHVASKRHPNMPEPRKRDIRTAKRSIYGNLYGTRFA